VRLDEARQHVEEERPLLWREGGEDAVLLGATLRAEVVMHGLARCTQAQYAGAPVLGVYAAVDIAQRHEPMDKLVSGYRVDAEAQGKGALINVWRIVQRGEDGELDGRQPAGSVTSAVRPTQTWWKRRAKCDATRWRGGTIEICSVGPGGGEGLSIPRA
jgi:hypothetical protein